MRIDVHHFRNTIWFPVVLGAIAGLLTGLLGLKIELELGFTPGIGGMVGAVGGGVTAAFVSDRGVTGDIVNAVVADAVSSIVFFSLVIASLSYAAIGDEPSLATVLGASAMYTFYGLPFAIAIANVSLVIAAASGAVTTLAKQTMSPVNSG